MTTTSAANRPGRQAMTMDEFPRRFGPYVLLKPLARGGMGALYLSLTGERGMEKLCVIKTALHHLADKSYVQRFRDEAKIVVRLSHGNLVTVFDAGQVEGELYLAMDFVEGRDLRAVWNRCAQKGIAFPIDVAVHIVKELVRGLGYAHTFDNLNLVHRDVSPPNVLVSYTGEVKLTDFGLASSTLKLEKTAPGVIYGKVSYMAPEQARGEPLDGRVDLYAAGIILWELLTGRQLFPATPEGLAGRSEDALLERVRRPVVAAPSKKTSRVPADLDRIVLKALAQDTSQRYQSGEELRADLAAFQAKNNPATDVEHVARFLRDLFADQITKERTERQQLLAAASPLLPKAGSQPVISAVHAQGPQVDDKTPPLRKLPGATRAMAPPARPAPADLTPVPDMTSTGAEAASRMVGGVLSGRYRILRLCGEGGMGRVYEAEHIEIGKHVAVKVLHPAYTRTPDVVERFRREARAASKIGHPNIVNVTDSGTTEDGSFFFVMEFIEGIELGLAIHRQGPLPVERTLHITEQMCNALQAAHDAGVIHRDLKPENVLLISRENEKDFVKVLDFGIAKSADVEEQTKTGRRLTRPGVAMGTPEYMAPEQAAGKPADPRSDIYAVGSIMYEMLTGVPPYDGDNVMEVLHRKATESPRPAQLLRQDLPTPVAQLVERAMARAPGQRPQSMAALAQEIRAVGAALAAHASAPGTPAAVPIVRRDTGLIVGSIEPPAGLTALGLSRRVVGVAAAALVMLTAFVVVRAATSHKARATTAAAAVVPPPAPPPRPAPVAPAPVAPPPPVAAAPVEPEPEATPDEPTEEPSAAKAHKTGKRAGMTTAQGHKLLQDGRNLVKAQRFDDARGVFDKLVEGKRERGGAFVGLGQIAFQQGNYDEAVKRAKQAAGAGGGAGARVLLGDAFFKLKKYAEASQAYGEALKLDPTNKLARQGVELTKRY